MMLNMTVKGKLVQIGEEDIMCKIVGKMKDMFFGYSECTCHNANDF